MGLNVRVSPAEKQRIQAAAGRCGLTLSEYLRQRALRYEPRFHPPQAFFSCLTWMDNLTDQLAERARSAQRFELAVTPEGTRSRVTSWKRGFYFIALKASLPVMLYAIDYSRKTIICHKVLMPGGDVESDMKVIMDYYRPYRGLHPERFAVEGSE